MPGEMVQNSHEIKIYNRKGLIEEEERIQQLEECDKSLEATDEHRPQL